MKVMLVSGVSIVLTGISWKLLRHHTVYINHAIDILGERKRKSNHHLCYNLSSLRNNPCQTPFSHEF